jgi:hypothetical protein
MPVKSQEESIPSLLLSRRYGQRVEDAKRLLGVGDRKGRTILTLHD